jgi:hypothetical protein
MGKLTTREKLRACLDDGMKTYFIIFDKALDDVYGYDITGREIIIRNSYKGCSHMISVVRAYSMLDAIALVKKEEGRLLGS